MLEGKPVPGRRVLVYDGDGYFTARRAGREARRRRLRGTTSRPVSTRSARSATRRSSRICFGGACTRAGIRQRSGRAPDTDCTRPRRGDGRVRRAARVRGRRRRPVHAAALATSSSTSISRPTSDAAGRGRIEALYRIGDCVAPQLIADAIFDGHRLAREIDAVDPATPLPYRRERPLPEAVATMSEFRSPLTADANAGLVALVTGGGTGIGRATALELARTGAARGDLRPPSRAARGNTQAAIEAAGGRVPRSARRRARARAGRRVARRACSSATNGSTCSSTTPAASSSPRPRRSRRTAGAPSTGSTWTPSGT